MANIKKVYTKTSRGSFAVEVTLKTTVLTSMENVIKQVGNTLRISTSRILKLWDPSDDTTKQSTSMNVRPLLYRFVITEDPLNDDTTPSFTYGSQLQTDYYKALLKKNLPQLDENYSIKLKIIQKNFPKFNKNTVVSKEWFYDAQVESKLNEKGQIFALVLNAELFTTSVNSQIAALKK